MGTNGREVVKSKKVSIPTGNGKVKKEKEIGAEKGAAIMLEQWVS